MNIFILRSITKNIENTKIPNTKGQFDFEIPIKFYNDSTLFYEKYIEAKKKKPLLEEWFVEDKIKYKNNNKEEIEKYKRKASIFRTNLKIYKTYSNVLENDFIYSVNKSTENIKTRSQFFSVGQVRRKTLDNEKQTIIISCEILAIPKPKKYGDSKEVTAFLGPGKFFQMREEFYEKMLYRGLGMVQYNGRICLPFEIASSNNSKIITLEQFAEFIVDLKEQVGDESKNTEFEIEIHSPGLGVIKKAGDISIIVYSAVAQESLKEDIKEDIKEGIEEIIEKIDNSSAINPEEKLFSERFMEVIVFNKNNTRVVTTIYKNNNF